MAKCVAFSDMGALIEVSVLPLEQALEQCGSLAGATAVEGLAEESWTGIATYYLLIYACGPISTVYSILYTLHFILYAGSALLPRHH